MPQILTFFGQPRQDCAVVSSALARRLAEQGARVLWLTQDSSPVPQQLWKGALGPEVQAVQTNLWTQQLQATVLLEQSWEVVKALEAQYLRSPLLKRVYGQELVVLPGMDAALALNALREHYQAGDYDYLVVDGASSQALLRMWALPENLDWYLRRFQTVIQTSELAQALAPFIQPIAGTILTISGSPDSLSQPLQQARAFLAAGRAAIQSPQQVLGFLVSSTHPSQVAATRYFWGCSQQLGLTVGGAISLGVDDVTPLETAFAPLRVHPLPALVGDDWTPLTTGVPDLNAAVQNAPAPVTLYEAERQVRLFLPGFTKADINLTQYGPEVTVTAGDYRRNLFLPESFKNRPVQGAKFQDSSLIVSF